MSAPIVLVTNDRSEVFQRSVIAGAEEISEQQGLSLEVLEVKTAQPALPEAGEVSGLIVLANVLSDTSLRQLAQRGVPVTLVSHAVPGLRVPAVWHNNRQGIALLMEHLVARGFARPVFIRGDMSQSDGLEREAAFRHEAMRYTLKLPETHFLEGAFRPAQARDALKDFLALRQPFDAVVAADYLMAIAALDVLRAEGWQVPEDVAVVGFGDGPEAEEAGLTTVAADVVELGRRAARQLLGQLQGLSISGLTLLSTMLVPRKTS